MLQESYNLYTKFREQNESCKESLLGIYDQKAEKQKEIDNIKREYLDQDAFSDPTDHSQRLQDLVQDLIVYLLTVGSTIKETHPGRKGSLCRWKRSR